MSLVKHSSPDSPQPKPPPLTPHPPGTQETVFTRGEGWKPMVSRKPLLCGTVWRGHSPPTPPTPTLPRPHRYGLQNRAYFPFKFSAIKMGGALKKQQERDFHQQGRRPSAGRCSLGLSHHPQALSQPGCGPPSGPTWSHRERCLLC